MVLQESLASFLKVSPERLFFDYFGLNHLAWARRVFLQGVDILPIVREALEHTDPDAIEALFGEELLKDPKVKTELANTLRIFKESGMMPSPYLQYYWFTDEIVKEQAQAGITRAQQVIEMEKQILASYQSALEHGKQPELQRGGKWHADMMVGVIGAVANDTRSVYIVNVPNHGALPDLPFNKIVEVPSLVDGSGPHPLAMGKMPAQVRGLVQSVAAYEELTVRAALEKSYKTALDALSCHPLVPSRRVAKDILDEYVSAHKDSLSYLS
jgi:6-phospho-beta-glucosidase